MQVKFWSALSWDLWDFAVGSDGELRMIYGVLTQQRDHGAEGPTTNILIEDEREKSGMIGTPVRSTPAKMLLADFLLLSQQSNVSR